MREIFWVFVLNILLSGRTEACTAVALKKAEQFVLAKNYSWYIGHRFGAAFTNARGVQKTALNLNHDPRPAQWVSRFGSITLTQFGRNIPIGGINEEGLVVEALQLKKSRHSSVLGEKDSINEGQWVQYQLDQFATVSEVVSHIEDLRVRSDLTGLHYFICDASTQCAVVEFLDGRPHVYFGHNLPVAALANHPYEKALAYGLEHYSDVFRPSVLGPSSQERFAIALAQAQSIVGPDFNDKTTDVVQTAWSFLKRVHNTGIMTSQWDIVYEPLLKKVSVRVTGKKRTVSLKLEDFNFDCQSTAYMIDLATGQQIPFNLATNQKLINKTRYF
jgi:choloylglycine hydrolase